MKIFLLLAAFVVSLPMIFASETINGAVEDYKTFKEEMKGKIAETEKTLKEVRTRSLEKMDETQQRALREIESTKAQIKNELDALKSDSKETSEKIKKRIAESINRLNEKIQKALKD